MTQMMTAVVSAAVMLLMMARMLVVMGRLWDLKSYAEAQGCTSDDYDAFRKDPVQKKRLK